MTGLTYLRMYVYNLYIIIMRSAIVQYYHTRRTNFQRCCITSRIIIPKLAIVYTDRIWMQSIYYIYYVIKYNK